MNIFYILLPFLILFVSEILTNEDDMLLDDIIYTKEQQDWINAQSDVKNLPPEPFFRWPNATVHYKFFGKFSKYIFLKVTYKYLHIVDDDHITKAANIMRRISKVSCVNFTEGSNSDGKFLYIDVGGSGCHSTIGYIGKPKLVLHHNCFLAKTLSHEFLHVLGFHHQQSAHNRDDYLTVLWDNIKDNKKANFKIIRRGIDFGVEYDFNSIVHYGAWAFTKNGNLTLSPKVNMTWKEIKKIGRAKFLSSNDITKLNRYYNCTVPEKN